MRLILQAICIGWNGPKYLQTDYLCYQVLEHRSTVVLCIGVTTQKGVREQVLETSPWSSPGMSLVVKKCQLPGAGGYRGEFGELKTNVICRF